MKKILFMFLVMLLFICACSSNEDALNFKNDYESLNNEQMSEDILYRSVSISEDNPFVYIDIQSVIDKINNEETFYLYIGDEACPWCRSVIEECILVANESNIDTIYYLPIWEDNFKEIFRDKYSLDDDNNLVLENEGTDEYKVLLELLDNVLEEYTLTSSDNEEISVNEKRIYAPSFIYIKSGVAKSLVTGISDKQSEAFDELSDAILEDEKEIFEDFFID